MRFERTSTGQIVERTFLERGGSMVEVELKGVSHRFVKSPESTSFVWDSSIAVTKSVDVSGKDRALAKQIIEETSFATGL